MNRGRPVPRERSGMIGRRFPRTGTEPVTARSALGLRVLLTAVFLPVFVAATVLFAVWAASSSPGETPGPAPLTGLAVASGVLALVAAMDGVVLLRRMRRERGRPQA
ncbi:DUF6343 family protein [Streptomyces sp. TRM72054]|uniref:DUF6343 family protein n=1 Tax=Streptomyces sp. TRM72054 TaxID=2870562 RepID=UPI0021AB1F3D|nr:DUF6343 family protein [Streptomyces sp. TRM72054]